MWQRLTVDIWRLFQNIKDSKNEKLFPHWIQMDVSVSKKFYLSVAMTQWVNYWGGKSIREIQVRPPVEEYCTWNIEEDSDCSTSRLDVSALQLKLTQNSQEAGGQRGWRTRPRDKYGCGILVGKIPGVFLSQTDPSRPPASLTYDRVWPLTSQWREVGRFRPRGTIHHFFVLCGKKICERVPWAVCSILHFKCHHIIMKLNVLS